MSEENNERKSRVDRMEQAVQILKALALRADERMDGFDSSLNNLTVKIEALTDAQIRHEAKSAAEMETVREAQRSLARKVEALVDAQIRSVERLVQSEERVTQKFEAIAEAHQFLTVKVEALANEQAETGRSLRELIEIVREGRGGGAA
jgi:alanyl-tRNA synthetase